jgi:aldehyde dehydrogenase (NAD+)
MIACSRACLVRKCRKIVPIAEFGGYNQSGLGREGGRTAIESYTALKTVMLPFTDEMM